jgi:hypothetical protein
MTARLVVDESTAHYSHTHPNTYNYLTKNIRQNRVVEALGEMTKR